CRHPRYWTPPPPPPPPPPPRPPLARRPPPPHPPNRPLPPGPAPPAHHPPQGPPLHTPAPARGIRCAFFCVHFPKLKSRFPGTILSHSILCSKQVFMLLRRAVNGRGAGVSRLGGRGRIAP